PVAVPVNGGNAFSQRGIFLLHLAVVGEEGRRQLPQLGQQRLLIDPGQVAAVHHYLAIDDDLLDGAAVFTIDQVVADIVEWQEVDALQVEYQQVGTLAHFQRTGDVVDQRAARPAQGGGADDLAGVEPAAVVRGGYVVQQAGGLHHVEHPRTVVGTDAVGTQRQVDSGIQQLAYRRDAGAEFLVGDHVVYHGDAGVAHQLDVPVRDPDRVGYGHSGMQDTQIVHVLDQRLAVVGWAGAALHLGLDDVGMQRHLPLPGQFIRCLQQGIGAALGRRGRDHEADAPGAVMEFPVCGLGEIDEVLGGWGRHLLQFCLALGWQELP